MSSNAVTKVRGQFPAIFDDFFKPWNEWFDGSLDRTLTVPAVNISEQNGNYNVTMAAPGLKKEDFRIDISGNLMTINAETKEEKKEEDKKYTKKEYNYSSFSRSFTLPEGINRDGIEAKYDNGVLTLTLPKNEETKTQKGQQIEVK